MPDLPEGRSRLLTLGDGSRISTPLLIPSVSSKGSGVTIDGRYEVDYDYSVVKDSITEALLVSAYDIHYERLPSLQLSDEAALAPYRLPLLLVIDSGGYEADPQAWESGEIMRSGGPAETWTSEMHDEVVAGLPGDQNLMLVSYDSYETYGEQVATAQRTFARGPKCLSNFLIKPPRGQRYVDPSALRPHVRDMNVFDVIGVTEKELGDSILDRMVTVAEMRRALDEEGVDRPIHVFGSLDPVFTPLYYMAGAEIFDGLTWLRYAYREGLSVYSETRSVLLQELDTKSRLRRGLFQAGNLTEIAHIKNSLERWAAEQDFGVFDAARRDALLHAYRVMQARTNKARR